MTDVPKIVRERLKAGIATDMHPDANVLTAFSERLLPESERAFVLHHLARCGECREVVSLALPEESSSPALQPVSSTGWFAWPNLRWAFVAAGILVIASLGTVQYRRYTQSSKMAAKRSGPAQYVKEAENKPVAAPVSPNPPAVQESKEASDKAEPPSVSKQGKQEALKTPARPAQPPAVLVPGLERNGLVGKSIGGSLPHGPRMLNQVQQQNANVQQQNAYAFVQQSAAAPAPAPFAKPAASQQAPAATPSQTAHGDAAKSAGQNETALTVQSESVTQQPSTYEIAQNNVERAKPADELHLSANRKVPAGSPAQFDRLSGKALAAPRWTINSSGALQRSYDQGNTWQDVNVAAAPPAADGFFAVEKSRPATKDSDVALAKKSTPSVFRAVAANGSDVWAGGSSGMLYHSIDSGIHWNRIIPAFSGFALTGDIIALDFPDAQHGKVTTSTSEVWTTSDAGQTWQKQ